jgi:hypothetical protein
MLPLRSGEGRCRAGSMGGGVAVPGSYRSYLIRAGDSYRRAKRISRTSAGIEKTTVNATPANIALISFLLIERWLRPNDRSVR